MFEEFYLQRSIRVGRRWLRKHEKEFISAILAEYIKYEGGNVCEVGLGSGSMMAVLADLGVTHVFGLDISSKLVDRAMKEFHSLGYHVCGCFVWDILKELSHIKFDLVYSDGLLEHFDSGSIETILRNMETMANNVVLFAVPGLEWSHSVLGDERLLSSDGWAKITGYEIISTNEELVIGRKLLRE